MRRVVLGFVIAVILSMAAAPMAFADPWPPPQQPQGQPPVVTVNQP